MLSSATCEKACGKLPTCRFEPRIVFLGEQADVVAQREQPLEQAPRVVVAAEQHVVVGQPEAAGEERAFAGGQSVVGRVAVVAQHEAVDEQVLLDRRDRAAHARIVGRQKADERNDAAGSASSSFDPYACTNALSSRVEAVRADVGVDLDRAARASRRAARRA